jgi:hypothetical protein
VKEEFCRTNAPFIVAKPLVESQNTPELLHYFENSAAVWTFRNYKAVALSNVNKFGAQNGIKDIRPIARHEANNWRSEKASEHIQETILKYFSEDMNPYDAAVLFWYARNSLFFDLELDKHPRVLMCFYEDLVLDPDKYVRTIYQKVGQVYPQHKITAEVHAHSRKKGKEIELSPEIERLAQGLQEKLEQSYRVKMFSP